MTMMIVLCLQKLLCTEYGNEWDIKIHPEKSQLSTFGCSHPISLPDCIVMSTSVVAFRQKLKQLHFFPSFVILEIHIVVYCTLCFSTVFFLLFFVLANKFDLI